MDLNTESEREQAVMVVELRLHGVHPSWIEWAQRQGPNTLDILKYMLSVLDGRVHTGDYLIPSWKQELKE